MSDEQDVRDGRYERDCAALLRFREGEDYGKFRAGLRVARMSTYYGGGIVERAAQESGYSDKTLYMRRDTALFILQFASAQGNIFFARRMSDNWPALTYTHFRIALPKTNFDLEEAIDSLLAVTDGDTEFEDWLRKEEDRALILPMTTRQFGQYVSWLRGGKPRPRPIFEGRGTALDLLRSAWSEIVGHGQANKEVKLTIKEPR